MTGRRRLEGGASDAAPPSKKHKRQEAVVTPFAVSFFGELLTKAGLVLGDADSGHTLRCETFTFVQDLKSTLENNVDFPRNAAELIEGLRLSCEDDEEVLACHFAHHITYEGEDSRTIQTTLVRLLLGVTCLQEYIVKFVIGRGVHYSIEDKPDKLQLILKPFILLENLSPEAEALLAKGLVQMLEIARHNARLEIIVLLPDVITHSEQQNIAPELCRFMRDDYELTPAILDCLTYFCLPNDLKMVVRDEMLTMLRTSAPPHFFPNLVSFFLVGCEHDAEVIHGLRDGLDWSTVGSAVDAATSQATTVLSLRTALRKSKSLVADWIKIINACKEAHEHKPLDVVILLILFSLKNGKEKAIENVFRKRIKSGLFTTNLVKSCLKNFPAVMVEYLSSAMELCILLMKSKLEPSIKEFGVYWMSGLFHELEHSRRNIINELMCHEAIEEKDHLSDTIVVLAKIVESDFEILKPYSLQLLSLVGKIDVLEAKEICQAMDILCGLAFGVENSLLQDDIHMLIRKQVTSSDLTIKIRGIASGIMAVKHLVCRDSSESPETTEDCSQISELPDGASKEAATIVELILNSTDKYPELMCYFYDEFSRTLSTCHRIQQIFLTWLINIVTNTFQNSFVTDLNEQTLKPIDNIQLSTQYCLNDAEEMDEPIAIDIANLALGRNADEKVDLRTLPSMFRFLQLMYKKSGGGDLSSVDALLGCGIIMPLIDDDSSLEEFSPEYKDKILHCFVHCINWFRELISAFCLQTEMEMKKKAITRLNEIVLLERKLGAFLNHSKLDDFVLPVSTFSGLSDRKKFTRDTKAKPKTKKGRKLKNKNSSDAETSMASNETLKTQENPVATNPLSFKSKLDSVLLRTLHYDVINLMNSNFKIESLNESASKPTEPVLNLDSLLFLCEELTGVSLGIFPPQNAKVSHHFSKAAKSTVSSVDAGKAMDTFNSILLKVCLFMEKMAEHTQKVIDLNDGIEDTHALFTEDNAKIQMCFTAMFKMLTVMFSWYGLNSPENKSKTIACFKTLAEQCPSEEKKRITFKESINKASIYAAQYQNWCVLAATAASLIKLLQALSKHSNDKQVHDRTIAVARNMLSKNWRDLYGNVEKGFHFNQNIDVFVTAFFSKPNIADVKKFTMQITEQCSDLLNKNSSLESMPCINKANFPLLFRAITKAIFESTKNEIEKGLTDKQHLTLWMDVAIVMKILKDILKDLDGRSNLSAFLKNSIPLLKLFLSQGMPMMDLKLKSDPDSVVEILRTLQHSTRFLHSLYCHSRLQKDTALIAYLPQMKLVLETMVYKVKASLTVNQCREAFWMGNLKNKNLQGEIISSQSTVQSSQNEDDEDQLPEDENPLSDTDEELNDDAKSVSSIF